MFNYPDTTMYLIKERQRELIAEADRYRLVMAALRHRRETKASVSHETQPQARSPVVLPGCGPRETAPAR